MDRRYLAGADCEDRLRGRNAKTWLRIVFAVAAVLSHAPGAFAQAFTHTYTPVLGQNIITTNSIWTPASAPNSASAFVDFGLRGGQAFPTALVHSSGTTVTWGGFAINAGSADFIIDNSGRLLLAPTAPYTSTIAEGRTVQLGISSTPGFLEGNANATLSNSGNLVSANTSSTISNLTINNSATGVVTGSVGLVLHNDNITGGIIRSVNSGQYTYQGGSLSNVTLTRTGTGFHEVTAAATLNGITVDNTVLHLRANTTLSGESSIKNSGTIDNNAGRTITMTAGANLRGESGSQLINRTTLQGQGTLTDVKVTVGGGNNAGTISATTGNFNYAGGSLSGQTLSAIGGNVHQVVSGTLTLFGPTTVAADTSLNVNSAGRLEFGSGTSTINGTLHNSSTTTTGVGILNNSVVAGSGTLINDAGAVISGNGTLNVANITNAGTIQGNNTSFGLTINSLGGVNNTGGTLSSGTSIGGVLTLNTTVTGGMIQVGGPASVIYAGGRITGSTLTEISGAAGTHKVTENTTFDNDTLAAHTAFTVDSGRIATIDHVFNSYGDITNNGTIIGHLVLQSGATYSGAGILDGQLDRIGSGNVGQANQTVGILGGTAASGGLTVTFPGLTQAGAFNATASIISVDNLPTSGALANINFAIPGQDLQGWDLGFGGTFSGLATLTFAYNQNLLGGANENDLQIYHWNGSNWEMLHRLALDIVRHTITVETTSFSPFEIGLGPSTTAVPEPSSLLMFALGSLAVGVHVFHRTIISTYRDSLVR